MVANSYIPQLFATFFKKRGKNERNAQRNGRKNGQETGYEVKMEKMGKDNKTKNLKGSQGKRFSKENQPAHRGRKKNVLTAIAKNLDMSKQDFDKIVCWALNSPFLDLLAAIEDDSINALQRVIASVVITAEKTGCLTGGFSYLLDRYYGKIVEKPEQEDINVVLDPVMDAKDEPKENEN